jgi:hypothetical protein
MSTTSMREFGNISENVLGKVPTPRPKIRMFFGLGEKYRDARVNLV